MEENQKVDQGMIMKSLDWAYDKAVNGIIGMSTAEELARSYMREEDSKLEMVNSLIRWQNTKAGTSGFVTGLGGIITLPIAIPANIASVIYVQIRMIAAIAYIGGYDLRDDKVKTLVYLCMAGTSAVDIIKEVGIVVGVKFTASMISKISGKVIIEINQKVGFRLLTKFGEKGIINLGKSIPLVGGLVGGAFDVFTTNTIGNFARDTFILHDDKKIELSNSFSKSLKS